MADGEVIAYSVRLFHLCPVHPRNVISLGTDRSEPLEEQGQRCRFYSAVEKGGSASMDGKDENRS
jgi:hypothetical protein